MQVSLLRYVAAQAFAIAMASAAVKPALAEAHMQPAGFVPVDPHVARLYADHADPSFAGADLYLLPYLVPVDGAPALLSVTCRTRLLRAVTEADDDWHRIAPCI